MENDSNVKTGHHLELQFRDFVRERHTQFWEWLQFSYAFESDAKWDL